MTQRMFMVVEGKLEVLKKPIFTTGDAYLVVDEVHRKIWVWLGEKCSVDEKATAAIEARRIDDGDVFNGQAKIMTIDAGDEPLEFLALLKGLIVLDKNLIFPDTRNLKHYVKLESTTVSKYRHHSITLQIPLMVEDEQ